MTNILQQKYDVIGLMSGTSLDGLDIAFCQFSVDNKQWKYEIVCAETIEYSDVWKQKLLSLETADALTFQLIHAEYGQFIGRLVADFIIKNSIKPDFVASHGHTIFHQPDKKLTVQVGSGAAIAANCKLPVVCDFRTLDVALGGQGAPLVPIGDQQLFGEYDFCLNLGGFANISYDHFGKRIAFDICPVNIVLNAFAARFGKKYDDKGEIARSGLISNYLLNEFDNLSHYRILPHTPKSLGKEWVINNIDPLIEKYELEDTDFMRTFTEHIAFQVARVINVKPYSRMLVTGGGTHNDFLMERIKALSKVEIIVADNDTINFKEALIFAFLGVLRWRGEVNCLKSVTGAREDSSGGSIYSPALSR
ncbi:MAG: anhydro-N-acetylmuramic acid kinase [Bacteroidetes bacterium]|nr:anhydro-N-acetylmuramic acid kinase [Bacteroidota bacterium]